MLVELLQQVNLEMAQNASMVAWTFEEVDTKKLEQIIENIFLNQLVQQQLNLENLRNLKFRC